MKINRASILLLATIFVTVSSLPVDMENIADTAALSFTDSGESLANRDSTEQDSLIQEEDSTVLDSDSEPTDSDSSGVADDSLERRIVKRSPDIPDPDRYKKYDHDDRPDISSTVHSTHDEYLEWKSKLPRFRRNLEDDSLNADYNGMQSFAENSLEDYAQGCEVMEENSDENNETTYNDYRRKRAVDGDSGVVEDSTGSELDEASDHDNLEDSKIDEKYEELEDLSGNDHHNEKRIEDEDIGDADLKDSVEESEANNQNNDSHALVGSEESDEP